MPCSHPIFRAIKPDLNGRLRLVFPQLTEGLFTVESHSLKTQTGSRNEATALTIRSARGEVIECVEKSIFKFPGFRPAELAIHDELHALENATILRLPETLGRIETPLAGIIYTRLLCNEGYYMIRAAVEAARGIAENESLSHVYIEAGQNKRVFRQLDFFRLWFRLHPRYNVGRALRVFEQLVPQQPQAGPMAKRLRSLRPTLDRLGKSLQGAPRCFSHLDCLRKNMMRSNGSLYLIDWGEARVGRIGFDAGSWLHAILRNDPQKFEAGKKKFLEAYMEACDPQFRNVRTRDAVTYLFAIRSLGFFLRRRVLREALENNTFDLLLLRLAHIANAVEKVD